MAIKLQATPYVIADPEYILQDQATREGVPSWYGGNTKEGLPSNAPVNIRIGNRMYQYPRRMFVTLEQAARILGYKGSDTLKNRLTREERRGVGVFGSRLVPCVQTRDGQCRRWLFLKSAVEALAKDPMRGVAAPNKARPESKPWLMSRLNKPR